MNINAYLTNSHYSIDNPKFNLEKYTKKIKKKTGYDVKSIERGVAHYQKDDHNIISLKGTNPKNLDDIKSDLAIANGTTQKDKQFRERKTKVKNILKTIDKKDTVDITAHSLGAGIATSIMTKSESIRNRVDNVHSYNAGYSKLFHKELTKGLAKPDREILNDKITHNRIKGDVVSSEIKAGAVGTVKTIEPERESQGVLGNHSLDNFI